MRKDTYTRRRATAAVRRATRRGNATLASELAAIVATRYRADAR